jgi:hypothetical protein
MHVSASFSFFVQYACLAAVPGRCRCPAASLAFVSGRLFATKPESATCTLASAISCSAAGLSSSRLLCAACTQGLQAELPVLLGSTQNKQKTVPHASCYQQLYGEGWEFLLL